MPSLSSWSSGVDAEKAAGTKRDKVVKASKEHEVCAANV